MNLDRFRRAHFIRRFEERLLELFAQGKLNGTVHTCLGQELSALALAEGAQPLDAVFSNHRGHGHYLAFRENPDGLMAEIMGRVSGICRGVGGSQHLSNSGFYSNGILGGMSPVGVGVGLALKLEGGDGISVIFHGDGALGEGVVYEAMNLAASWEIPVLWVIEKNGYAQSTACDSTTAGTIVARAAAFGIPHYAGSVWEHEALFETAKAAVSCVRSSGKPALLEIETYRLAAHSKGDDNRAPEEIERFRQNDPLNRFAQSEPELWASWDAAAARQLDEIVSTCEGAENCSFQPTWNPRVLPHKVLGWEPTPPVPTQERYAMLLYRCFSRLFEEDSRLLMIGEDIEGPYGGAFKVSRDLSAKFPGRVRNTPISEAAITGVGTGLALRKWRPIVEIMFGDFLSLTFDQLIQHACKFDVMYGGDVAVPLIIRTPMGGRRGYGPTHSQSIEGHFIGIPGLDVFALNHRVAPERVYVPLCKEAKRPALVIENKILYTRPLREECPPGYICQFSEGDFPFVRLSPVGRTPQVTVVCYGGMLEEVEAAAVLAFQEQEIFVEVVCPTQLVPFNINPVKESAQRSGRVLIVEEGKTFAALGSEILALLVEEGIQFRACRVGYDSYIPSSYFAEMQLLPNSSMISETIIRLAYEN